MKIIMATLIIFGGITVLLLVIGCICYSVYSDFAGVCWFFSFIFGIILTILLITIPYERASDEYFIDKLEAVRVVVKDYKGKGFDSLAIYTKVSEMNERLAELKYKRTSSLYALWTSEKVKDVKPIE